MCAITMLQRLTVELTLIVGFNLLSSTQLLTNTAQQSRTFQHAVDSDLKRPAFKYLTKVVYCATSEFPESCVHVHV